MRDSSSGWTSAVEAERRKAEVGVPKREVEETAFCISEWMRAAFTQFLSSESESLMGIKDLGEFKVHAIERFRGSLCQTVKAAIRDNPPIPEWALPQIFEAWNIN